MFGARPELQIQEAAAKIQSIYVLEEDQIDALLKILWRFDAVRDVRELTSLMDKITLSHSGSRFWRRRISPEYG